jgi:Holliday junction resolvase RusA-like endonuclease
LKVYNYTVSMSSREIEDVVAFTVPYLTPPSGNHYKAPCLYRDRNGVAHRGYKVTPQAKAYKDAVAIFARGRTVAPLDALKKKTHYDVQMTVVLGHRERGDEDNFHKVGLDALTHAGVIHSDAYAHCVCNVVRDDRENPRTEYTIRRAN